MYTCILLASVLVIQTIQVTLSPVALKAMATLQTQKAKAIANALRARAHYNAALARTNLGLLDHRVIRNIDYYDGDYDDRGPPPPWKDYFDWDSVGDYVNIGEGSDEGIVVGAAKVFPDEEQKKNDPDPTMVHQSGDNSNTDENLFQIPLDGDKSGKMDQATNFEREDDARKQGSMRVASGIPALHCLGPFQPVAALPPNPTVRSSQKSEEANLEAQQTFPSSFGTNSPQFAPPILVPMQYLPQGVPGMQFLPQGNFPMQSLSPFPSGYSPHMILLKPAPHETKEDDENEPRNMKQQFNNTIGSAEPHLHPFSHTHTHTHTHTHFKDAQIPFQTIQVPGAQVMVPGLNVHVVQNQNSAVAPQQIPTASIQPGFNTAGVKIVNPGGNVYNPVPTTTIISGNEINQPTGHVVVSPGTSISQSQAIHASPPTNTQFRHAPPVGGNAFTQSQAVLQSGRVDQPVVGIDENNKPIDEQVGTFMTDFRIRAPQSPENFDPKQPQNLQPVINYIESQEGNMRRMLHSIEQNENLAHHFGGIRKGLEYISSPNYENTDNPQEEEKLGTFPLENIHLNPPPTLPANFLELNADEQQESLKEYVHEEQRNVKDFLEQIEENNQRNLDSLSSLINSGPALLPEIQSFPDNHHDEEEEDNFNDMEPDITGNPQDYTEANDEELQDMLTKFLENDPQIQEVTGFPMDTNSNLGHIIDVPERRETDWYLRFARSLNKTSPDKLDKLLMAEREVINELQKDAKHDEDLMMIGYIGENIIKDLERKRNETKRTKRDIGGSVFNSPLNRLIVDPKTRLNVPKTLDNLGAVAKHAFEHEKAPLYHVRNMMGSAQDAVMATMKIPTKNFLIPSQYDIVNRDGNPLTGDINPNFFPSENTNGEHPQDHVANTFQMVGSAIRGGVLSGQEALGHVGEAANHAKNAIHSTRHAAPRLTLKQVPSITRESGRKAVLITPRIFDISSDTEQVGRALGNSQGGFVKMGHILEAVGLSNPNTNDVRFEKITMEPKGMVSIFNTPDKSRPSKMLQNFLESMKVEDFNEDDTGENELGNTLSTLQNVRESLGVGSLKDLVAKMRQDIKEMFMDTPRNNIKGHPVFDSKSVPKPMDQTTPTHDTQTVDKGKIHVPGQANPNQEVVKASLIPDYLLHPFMGQVSQKDMERLWKESNVQMSDSTQRDRHLGQILGAVNPLMFERIFNESVTTRSDNDNPHSVYYHHHDGHSHGFHGGEEEEEEEVGTSMKLSGPMLKPFMGYANAKQKSDFFHKYMPDSGESRSEESKESKEHKKMIETPDWLEVFDRGNRLEY